MIRKFIHLWIPFLLLLLLSCGFFQDDSIDSAAPKSCPEGDALDTLPITHRLLDRVVDTLPELFMDSATYAVATLAIVMEHASLLDADTVQSMGCSGEKGVGVEQLRCAYRIGHLRYDGQHEDRDLGFMRQRGRDWAYDSLPYSEESIRYSFDSQGLVDSISQEFEGSSFDVSTEYIVDRSGAYPTWHEYERNGSEWRLLGYYQLLGDDQFVNHFCMYE